MALKNRFREPDLLLFLFLYAVTAGSLALVQRTGAQRSALGRTPIVMVFVAVQESPSCSSRTVPPPHCLVEVVLHFFSSWFVSLRSDFHNLALVQWYIAACLLLPFSNISRTGR